MRLETNFVETSSHVESAPRARSVLLLSVGRIHHDAFDEHVLSPFRVHDEDDCSGSSSELDHPLVDGYVHGFCYPSPIHERVCQAISTEWLHTNRTRWLSWLRWLNPVYYGFEAVLTNEFEGRQFECSEFVPSGPSYQNIATNQRACAVQGSRPGEDFVGGTAYMKTSFQFSL
jgi:hypothetical protein